jgi:hypothetical protein
MNIRRPLSVRLERQAERAAKVQTERILATADDILLKIHRSYYGHLLSEQVESAGSELQSGHVFLEQYTEVIGTLGTKIYAATEKARKRRNLDEIVVARGVGSALFKSIGVKHGYMADSVFASAAKHIRADAGVSGLQALLSPIRTLGTTMRPSEMTEREPGFLAADDIFVSTFDRMRTNRDVTSEGISVYDAPGLLRMASRIAIIPLLNQEAFAFNSSLAVLQEKIMPSPTL